MSEIGTRLDLPNWANGGSADVVEPSSTKKLQGWVEEKPPHNWFNWWMERVYDWLTYLDVRTPRQFDDLQTACEELSVGELGWVNSFDESENWMYNTAQAYVVPGIAGSTSIFIDADGELVFCMCEVSGPAFHLYCWERDGTLKWINTTDFGATYRRVFSDGSYLWVIVGQNLYKIDRHTGVKASGWTTPYNHGQNIYSVYSVGDFVWIAGGTGANNVRCIDTITKAVVQNYSFTNVQNDTGWGIYAVGDYAWITLNSNGTFDNLYRLVKTSGTPELSMEILVSGAQVYGTLTFVGRSLYIFGPMPEWAEISMETFDVIKSGTTLPYGASQSQTNHSAYDGSQLWLYCEDVSASQRGLYCMDPITGHVYFEQRLANSFPSLDVHEVRCDADGVYVALDAVGIYRFYSGHRPFLVRRVEADLLGSRNWRRPWPHLVVPAEER